MRIKAMFVVTVSLALTACDTKKENPPQPTNDAAKASSGNPITAPVDYLGAVGAAKKQAVKVIDLTQLQQAIRTFQAGEDRLPSNLQELVSEGYLPALPAAPRGMQFAYNPQSGQVQVMPAVPR